MALIPNNPRIGGFMGRAALPGQAGIGNTGIVPPSMAPRPSVDVSTGGQLPPAQAQPQPGGYDPARPVTRMGGAGGTTIPTSPMNYYNTVGPQAARVGRTAFGAMPMSSGSTMPGLPRPPVQPASTQMSLPDTNAQGGPVSSPMATGRPAGGLFPRLG